MAYQNPYMDTMTSGAKASAQTMSVANSMMHGVQRAMDSSSDIVFKMQSLLQKEEERKVNEGLQRQKLIQQNFQFGIQDQFKREQLDAQETRWRNDETLRGNRNTIAENTLNAKIPLWKAQTDYAKKQNEELTKNSNRWDKYYDDAKTEGGVNPAVGGQTDKTPGAQRVDDGAKEPFNDSDGVWYDAPPSDINRKRIQPPTSTGAPVSMAVNMGVNPSGKTPVNTPINQPVSQPGNAPSVLPVKTQANQKQVSPIVAADNQITERMTSIATDMQALAKKVAINDSVPKGSPPVYPGAKARYDMLSKQYDALSAKKKTIFDNTIKTSLGKDKERTNFVISLMGRTNNKTGLPYTLEESVAEYNKLNGTSSQYGGGTMANPTGVKDVDIAALNDTAATQYFNQLKGKNAGGVANAISYNITKALSGSKNKGQALLQTPRFMEAITNMALSDKPDVTSHLETLYNNLGLTTSQRSNITDILTHKVLTNKSGVQITQDKVTGNLTAHVPDKFKNTAVGSSVLSKIKETNDSLNPDDIETYLKIGQHKSWVGSTMATVGSWFGGKGNDQQRRDASRTIKELNYSFYQKYGVGVYSELMQWDIGNIKDPIYSGGVEFVGNTPDSVVDRPWTAPAKAVVNGVATDQEMTMQGYVVPNIANKPTIANSSFINLDKMTPKHREIYERNMAAVAMALRSHRMDNGNSYNGKRVGDNNGDLIVIRNLRRFGNKMINPKTGLPMEESVQMTVQDAYAMLAGMSYTSKLLGG